MKSRSLSPKLPINGPSSNFQVSSNLSDESILENEINWNYFDVKKQKRCKEIEKDSWRNVWDLCIVPSLCRHEDSLRIL